MLELKKICKDYYVAGTPVRALDNINVSFSQNEFVAILGASGGGKTTLLNIIGGLDRYTEGDLLIDGKSTKDFKDREWDSYRNQAVGFVFQSYNLISHLSILENVDMSLRLSGVTASERKERSLKVLEQVGLIDHIYKKPNQLSGGQMQRVAIARALVNDPKVLLADEPTGALDTKTSKQIMELIREISKDILVIMVTHNPEIAHYYADRIVSLADGEIISDMPNTPINDDKKKTNTIVVGNSSINTKTEGSKLETKKTKMSFLTALKSSFRNLLTKKGRTIITAVAGSIGIIGIALVLAVSAGMNRFVERMQRETLAGFPVSVLPLHTSSIVTTGSGGGTLDRYPDTDHIYVNDPLESMPSIHMNIITQELVDHLKVMDPSLTSTIMFNSAYDLHIATKNNGVYTQYVREPLDATNPVMASNDIWNELPSNQDFVLEQYDLLAGSYPTNMNETIIVVDSYNRIPLATLIALGIPRDSVTNFNSLLGYEIKALPNNLVYQKNSPTNYSYNPNTAAMFNDNIAISTSVVGILRAKPDTSSMSSLLNAGFNYHPDLTTYLLNDALTSDIVLDQIASPSMLIIPSLPLPTVPFPAVYSDISYTLKRIGGNHLPFTIDLFATTLDAKTNIQSWIDIYNDGRPEVNQIRTLDVGDMVGNVIGSMVDTITVILVAFAAISLVVSSIMIGIITYVSVIERTKEIGIMRSLGARKKDILRIFNSETIIIGAFAGTIGVLITYLLIFPINLILSSAVGISGFAYLGPIEAISLIALSTVLTLISGLIPSNIASKRDPVKALRSE